MSNNSNQIWYAYPEFKPRSYRSYYVATVIEEDFGKPDAELSYQISLFNGKWIDVDPWNKVLAWTELPDDYIIPGFEHRGGVR